MAKNNKRVKTIVLVMAAIMISICCTGCKQNVQWKPIEGYEKWVVSGNGIKIYIDKKTAVIGSEGINLIILNESDVDIAVHKMEADSIQKEIDGYWNIFDFGERQRTGEIKYTVIPKGTAICEMIDVRSLKEGLTEGSYRVEVCVYSMDEIEELGEKFYMYCEFDM